MGNVFKIVVIGVVVALLLLVGPWLFLWSINTLVAEAGVLTFHIPFNFWTWLASALLMSGIGYSKS